MAKPIIQTATFLGRIFRIFVLFIIALLFLGFAALGKLFFRNLKPISLINEVRADAICWGFPPPPPSDCGNCGNNNDCGTADCGAGNNCFKAGTFVAEALKKGKEFTYKKIEDLKAGDNVLGIVFNSSGEPALKKSKVLKLFAHETGDNSFSELITDDGAKIAATNNHRIIADSENNGVKIEYLTKRHSVVTAFSKPKWTGVSEVRFIGNEVAPLFNIRTGTSNYLVSQDGKGWVLVHNDKD